MDLQTRKLALIQEFLKIQSEEIIAQLEKVLKSEENELHQKNITPMRVEELNARIDASLEDSKNGKLISESELKANIDRWS